MPKLSDLYDNDSYLQLLKINKSEIVVLWACDFWDNPINGVLSYQGKKYWFEMRSESEDPDSSDYYRRYLIIELTDEQLKEEEYWYKLFQEKVGHHMDGGGINKEALGQLKPKEIQSEFYDAHKLRRPRDLSNNNVIGWVEV